MANWELYYVREGFMMSLFEPFKPDFVYKDARGKIVQVAHVGFEQINILKSYKGTFRGCHFHKLRTEAFYVISGSVEVFFSQNGESQRTIFHEDESFIIRPNIIHNMVFPEDCTMLQLYDHPVENENGEKDIYPV